MALQRLNPKSSFSVAPQLPPSTAAHTASIIVQTAEYRVRANPPLTGEGGLILKSETAHYNLFPASVSIDGPALTHEETFLAMPLKVHANIPLLLSQL